MIRWLNLGVITHLAVLAVLPVLSIGSLALARQVEFSWASIEGAVKYEIQVDSSQSFSKAIITTETEGPSFSTDLKFGEYFYRVRVLDKKNRPGKWSNAEPLVVSPYAPELESPVSSFEISYYEILPELNFKWKPVVDKNSYEILIKKVSGTMILEKVVSSADFKTELSEGEYEWKVRTAVSKTLLSPYSDARKFTVIKKPMTPPELITPPKDGLSAAYRPLEFTWSKDPHAEFTDLTFEKLSGRSAGKTFKKKILNLQGTSYKAEYEEPGDYEWSVRAKEGKNTVGLTSVTNLFEVRDDILSAGNYELEFSLSPMSDLVTTTSARQTNGSSPVAQQSSGSGLLVGFTGGYWATKSFGLFVRTRTGTESLENFSSNVQDTDLTLRARFGSKGFNQEFWLGYKIMDIIEAENSPSVQTTNFTGLGPMIGSRLNPTIKAGLKASLDLYYYKPTSNVEGITGLTADIFGASIGVQWNFMYQFWVGYRFKFDRMNANFLAPGASPSVNSSWTTYRTEPFYLSLSFMH